MTPYLSHCQAISLFDVEARQLLSRGHRATFELPTGPLTFTLGHCMSPPDISNEALAYFNTQHGAFALCQTQAETWLNLISQQPYPSGDISAHTASSWQYEIYRQHLHPALQPLLTPLTLCSEETPLCHQNTTSWHWVEMLWQHNQHHGSVYLLTSLSLLRQWLALGCWQTISQLDDRHLNVCTPLTLGDTKVSQSIDIGDVLLVSPAYFSVSGSGFISLANHIIEIDYQPQGTQPHYLITQVSSSIDSEVSMFDPSHSNGDFTDVTPSHQDDAINASLRVVAGHVSLSLAQLRSLAPGQVLIPQGEASGYASIYHGNTRIARGEIVAVENQLGVQISEILLPVRTQDNVPHEPENLSPESTSWD